MKTQLLKNFAKLLVTVMVTMGCFCNAQATQLRRPVSPESPMWIIHIDTWNTADPQKIIDLIPADIRPYAVMVISLSINHDSNTGEFLTCPYGYSTAKSWARTCAENNMWFMVQPSSGGFCHFSNTDLTVYEEFYKEFPSFIGWNFAEQFWGFDDKWSCTFDERLALFVKLMDLANKYGGYLVSSWCGAYWGANLNPVAMMKRSSDFATACARHPENFILSEKYTNPACFYDIESTCLGAFLSGLSTYGIRYDQCGSDPITQYYNDQYNEGTGAIPVAEHAMLTGQTVIDGPELIWQQDFRNMSDITTPDGYKSRHWQLFPQFTNINIDYFRKLLDKTIRIPSRQEVIDQTKLVIINDINTGDNWSKYSTPKDLFTGLYKMDEDGEFVDNLVFTKKTGRYPTIPMVYTLADDVAKSFQVKVNKSAYTTRWPNQAAKVAEFNQLFHQEYTGDIYARRLENGWVTYNPYISKVLKNATGSIPFKYNTCDHIDLDYAQFTMGIMKEFSDHITMYLTNYEVDDKTLAELSQVTDVIKIYGAKSQPTYSFTDRGQHSASSVTSAWSNNVLTLTIKHNGPIDLTINCEGNATGRLTDYTEAKIVTPEKAAIYTGPVQYECENFDFKNIQANYPSATYTSTKNYSAMGYLAFGKNTAASIRDTVTAMAAGTHCMSICYSAPDCDVNSIDVYVNGQKSTTLKLAKTADISTWTLVETNINLKEGKNVVEFRANGYGAGSVNFDYIVLTNKQNNFATITPIEGGNGIIPRGWITYGANPGVRGMGNNYVSGPRMFSFNSGDFTEGLYFRSTDATGGYASYGEDPYTPLYLTSGTYTIDYNLAAWQDATVGSKVKFEVLNSNGTAIFTQETELDYSLSGEQNSMVNGSDYEKVAVSIPSDGDYILKWSVDGSNGWTEVVLANVGLVEGDKTGVEKINSDEQKDGPVFDIFGRRVYNNRYGFVIDGGKKKYIIK